MLLSFKYNITYFTVVSVNLEKQWLTLQYWRYIYYQDLYCMSQKVAFLITRLSFRLATGTFCDL